MANLTIPNNFSPNTVAFSALVNQNFQQIVNWSTTIDSTNLAGGSGIYASQVIPTTGPQATFGGSLLYTFPAAVYSNQSAETPSSFIWNADTSSGAHPYSALYSDTSTIVGGIAGDVLLFGNTSTLTGAITTPMIAVDEAGNLGVLGAVRIGRNSAASAFAPPVYNSAGAALSSNTHIVTGQTGASGVTSVSVTLTGAAVFSSASFQVVATVVAGGASVIAATPSSASGFTITFSTALTGQVSWTAIGA